MQDNFKFNWTTQTITEESQWDNEAYVLEKLRSTSLYTFFDLISPHLLQTQGFVDQWVKEEQILSAQTFRTETQKWEKSTSQMFDFFTSETYLNSLQRAASPEHQSLYIYSVFFALLRAQDNLQLTQLIQNNTPQMRQKDKSIERIEHLLYSRVNFLEPDTQQFGDLLSVHLSEAEIEEKLQRIQRVVIDKDRPQFLKDYGFSLCGLKDFPKLSKEELELCFLHSLQNLRNTFRYRDVEAAFGINLVHNKNTLQQHLINATEEDSYQLYNKAEIGEFQQQYAEILKEFDIQDMRVIAHWNEEGNYSLTQLDKLKKVFPHLFSIKNSDWRLELEKYPYLLDEKLTLQLSKKDPLWLHAFVVKNATENPTVAHYLSPAFVNQYMTDPALIEALSSYLPLEVMEHPGFSATLFTEPTILAYLVRNVIGAEVPKAVSEYLSTPQQAAKALGLNPDAYRLLSDDIKYTPLVYFAYVEALSSTHLSISNTSRYIFQGHTAQMLQEPKAAIKIFELTSTAVKQNLLFLVPEAVWQHAEFIIAFSQALDKRPSLYSHIQNLIPYQVKEYIDANQAHISQLGSYVKFFEIELQKQYLNMTLTPGLTANPKKHKI